MSSYSPLEVLIRILFSNTELREDPIENIFCTNPAGDPAQRLHRKPYVLGHQRQLSARLRPRTLDELMLAHGIGPSKAEKYGAGILGVVSSSTHTNGHSGEGETSPDSNLIEAN